MMLNSYCCKLVSDAFSVAALKLPNLLRSCVFVSFQFKQNCDLHSDVTKTSMETDHIKEALNKIFSNYCQTLHHEDLIFSTECSSRERCLINEEGQQWGLRWSTFVCGSRQEKFIALSYHRTPLELLEFLRTNGRETIRYKLVEATTSSKDRQKIHVLVTLCYFLSVCEVTDVALNRNFLKI